METEIFKEEAVELLEEIEETLLQLRDAPDDISLIHQMFRNFHTIKGSGAMFGFNTVSEFAHGIENTLDAIRQGTVTFQAQLLDPLLTAHDILQEMIDMGDTVSDNLQQSAAGILQEIDTIITGDTPQEKRTEARQPLKMLIVEDEFASRFILHDFLSSFGTCHVATDGYEAITGIKTALIEKKPYDLISLDIKMPGIDGKSVSEEIRRLEKENNIDRKCRIVMVSGIDDQQFIDELLEKKYCDSYLSKPISIKKYSEFIKEAFGV